MKRDERNNPDAGKNPPGEKRIPVMQEDLHVGVRKVNTGTLRAIKMVHEEDLIVSGPVVSDELQIERVTLNQYIDESPPAIRHEGDTMIIPVVEEEVVVTTRLKLVEEVRITRRAVERTIERPVTLRTEEVVVKRSGSEA